MSPRPGEGRVRSSRSRWALRLSAGLGALALLCGLTFYLRDAAMLRHLERAARSEFEAGHVNQAAQRLERWLQLRPRSAEAHFLRARIALARGDLGEVSAALRRAQRFGLPPEQVARFHAIVLSRVGRYAEAEPLLLQALTAARRPDPEVEEALARVYLRTYRLTQAAAMIDRWRRDSPRDATPYVWLIEIDRRVHVDDLGVQELHYRAALDRNPLLDKTRLGLADLLRTANRNAEAKAEYARYLARHPDDPAALSGAGQVALAEGDDGTAADLLGRALEHAPGDPTALRAMATIELRHGNPERAMQRLDRAVRADPYDAETRHARSLALARVGRASEAEDERRARDRLKAEQAQLLKTRDKLMVDPNNNDLRADVAAWMFAHGRDEEAIQWAQNVLAVAPDHPLAVRLLADYHQRRGEFGKANAYRLRLVEPASQKSPSAGAGSRTRDPVSPAQSQLHSERGRTR